MKSLAFRRGAGEPVPAKSADGMYSKEEEYVSVEYTGMGFFACTREVLEKLEYPYFHTPLQEIELEDGDVARDMASEDVSFCKNIKAAGYDIVVKTSLRVGHEKNVVL